MKQLKEALNRRCVKRLTQTYLTLSLEDIASKTGVASAAVAEQTLLEMVRAMLTFARADKVADATVNTDACDRLRRMRSSRVSTSGMAWFLSWRTLSR